MQCHVKKVEIVGNEIYSFQMILTQFREGIQFNYRSCLKLLETNNLQNITDYSLELSGSIHGNTITKSYNYITTGFKMIDLDIICSIISKILNLNINMHNINNSILIQSQDRYFLMKITIGQENKEKFLNFKDFQNFLIDLTTA